MGRKRFSSPTHYKSAAHQRVSDDAYASRVRSGAGLNVKLDLRPLSQALAYMGKGSKAERDKWASRAINRGLERFKGAAHKELKVLTKITQPTRLKKGVRLIRSSPATLTGTYVITDRNIPITKRYFRASYRNFGRAGGMARWHRGGDPAGAKWTSWDGTRVGKTTFMIKGKAPVFIRLHGSKRLPLSLVSGPNPAQLVALHKPRFEKVMASEAGKYLQQAIDRAYRKAEADAKAKFGL